MIDTFASVSLDDLAGLNPDDALILTVNNRHARRILAELSASLSDTRRVMAVPDIVPLSGWLARIADQLSFVPEAQLASHTVDAFGSQFLWQRVIADAESDHVLLDVSQAARLAAQADQLLDEWRINVIPEVETTDYQRFMVWRRDYRMMLAEMDLEDSNLAYERIHSAIRDGLLVLPFANLVLAGFNEISPRLSSLLDALQEQGIEVLSLEAGARAESHARRVIAPDPDAEWRMAAQWAAGKLQQHPEGRFAIVAARLEADVVLAHRSLRAALGTDAQGRQVPYNIAVARPLSEWPLVRAALAWLRILALFAQRKYCAPADLGQALLAGGCAGGIPEASGRAAIDALWRKQAKVTVSLAEFRGLLEQHAPRLAVAWGHCEQAWSPESGTADMHIWTTRFRSWLQALGFPGQAGLDSHAYQVVEAFDGLVDRLARQAPVVGVVGFSAAVGMLSRLARETPFQPQRDPSAKLDVLGFLESEGGRWDGIWVLGLTDDVLPAVPKPNPFIPLAALRQANAPRATPERELNWARSMYDALLACAPEVLLSHAQHQGETELRPSPCISALSVVDMSVLAPAPEPDGCELEYVFDERGPALQAGVKTRGGIGVIDTQARNPLWAFVKYRLGASQLVDYADISDQNARGIFLHKAIELVWRLLHDQQGLRDLESSGGLEGLLEQVVEQAADECLQDYGGVLRSLETARAKKVLQDWLALELTREAFRVRDVEQEYQWSHGPLDLKLRLDRIDELHDGRLAVIDYKAGDSDIDPRSDWMRTRPVGLQLPFYAAVLAGEDQAVAALVLARLHARETKVKGLVDGDYGLDGLSTLQAWPAFAGYSWNGLMAEWRRTIESLADEYAAGAARNETWRADDIKYCDVLPFLRLTEEYQRVD
ncbi:PD-(D/E)XK nuclease family protein [Pollutimonas bauzanensis]|uniref:PD-(D/E)XK nuclease family protein n=1 Tax=Pollutimonas bauzanensis TaxID=658167 RepID=UPI00334153E1